MKKNIAVVGCGHWGGNLVRNFYELGVLACLCDHDTKLASKLAKNYKTDYLSFDEVISNPDIEGIALAVPAPLHASLAIKALEMKKDVFVEKPLAMNELEAMNMIEASKINKKNLMVGHLLQYHPIFRHLKEIVEAGTLGKLNYIYSNRLSLGKVRSEEDVIWSFAPHDISMILSLARQEPKLVMKESANILQEGIDDKAMVHMTFDDGLKAHIFVSWLHPYKEQKLVVIGDRAMAVFDDTLSWDRKLALYRHKIDLSMQPSVLQKSEVEYIDVPQAEPLKLECKYFIDLIEGVVPPLTDGEEGLRVLKVLTAASLSQSNENISKKNSE